MHERVGAVHTTVAVVVVVVVEIEVDKNLDVPGVRLEKSKA